MNAQTYYLRRCINFIQHKNCVTIILRIKILTVINPSIYFLSLLIGGQKRSIKIHINKYADNKPLHLCLYAFWTRKKRLTGFYCNASRLLSVCAWNIWVHDLMSYVYTIKMNASELNHFGIFCTIYPKVLNISTEELKKSVIVEMVSSIGREEPMFWICINCILAFECDCFSAFIAVFFCVWCPLVEQNLCVCLCANLWKHRCCWQLIVNLSS